MLLSVVVCTCNVSAASQCHDALVLLETQMFPPFSILSQSPAGEQRWWAEFQSNSTWLVSLGVLGLWTSGLWFLIPLSLSQKQPISLLVCYTVSPPNYIKSKIPASVYWRPICWAFKERVDASVLAIGGGEKHSRSTDSQICSQKLESPLR